MFIHTSCAIACLLLSSTFHLFCAHSAKMSVYLSRFDYSGIAILICGSTFPPIVYGFACSPGIKLMYIILISTFCIFAFAVTLMPNSDQPNYRKLRGFLFIIVGLTAGIIPFHAALTNDPNVLVKLFYWALGGIVYVSGALLYIARIPERCCPGLFDYFVIISFKICRDKAIIYFISL